MQDHQEGIAAKVVLDLSASLERLSLAALRSTESVKARHVQDLPDLCIVGRKERKIEMLLDYSNAFNEISCERNDLLLTLNGALPVWYLVRRKRGK